VALPSTATPEAIMLAPLITDLPAAPSRTDEPATFTAKADALVAALQQFVDETNALATYLEGLGLDRGDCLLLE
jgi:hypothetical protein